MSQENETNVQAAATPSMSLWSGDVLGRQPYAEYLENFLRAQTKAEEPGASPRSCCIAIDADWGAGKTFFVTKWREALASSPENMSFVFDAWAADFHADPIIAFMAAFRASLDDEIKALPNHAAVNARVQITIENGMRKFWGAVVPAAKLITLGVVKKASGVALDELAEVVSQGSESESADPKETSSAGVSKEWAEQLNNVLKDQASKAAMFKAFRDEMADALEVVRNEGKKSSPFYVFIDEIDRCRPTFALELLEGLKHIFSIPGVCFIVSTNVKQLSNAVCAVYGAGFDGRRYLQRFFDLTFNLPAPRTNAFAESVLMRGAVCKDVRTYSGAPGVGFQEWGEANLNVSSFAWVMKVFGVDLRTQLKVAEQVGLIHQGLKSYQHLHLLWLTVLVAAKEVHPALFEYLCHHEPYDATLKQHWALFSTRDTPLHYLSRPTAFDPPNQQPLLLSTVVAEYHRLASTSVNNFVAQQNRGQGSPTFASELHSRLFSEASRGYSTNADSKLSIAFYADLVRFTGHA